MMYTDLYSFEGPAATDAVSSRRAVRDKSLKTKPVHAAERRGNSFAGAVGGTVTAFIGNFGAKPQHNRK